MRAWREIGEEPRRILPCPEARRDRPGPSTGPPHPATIAGNTDTRATDLSPPHNPGRRRLDALRLAAFPLGYGITGALAGGTLNRILVAEMGLPLTLVGFLFALPMLEAPLRVWFGYRSDSHPVLGRRREPYIVAGSLLAAAGLAATVALMTSAASRAAIAGGLLLTFVVYGFGRNLAHNVFQALVADRFEGDARSRALTLYEVATMLGLVAGAGGLGQMLRDYEPAKLVAATAGAVGALLLLTLVAVLGQERRGDHIARASAKSRELAFGAALREFLLGDPQVRRFFLLIVCTFVGTLAQDVLLEPYGALVLGMSVAETTRLTAWWGGGVLVAMLLSGGYLLRVTSHLVLLRIGLVATIAVFAGVIGAGLAGSPGAFRLLVGLMGLGTGLSGAGLLGGIATFATPVRAGMLMGVWGTASLMGKAAGSLMGGAVVDAVRLATGAAFPAYATVFAIEAILLAVAFALSFRLSVAASRAGREAATA
jgi:BCD family chlorophyll transporter-like MFS transporter